MSVIVKVLPAAARYLFDQPLQITVKGLSPLQDVTLTASLKDETGHLFQSSAYYRADQKGELDLSCCPALGGSYNGVEPMGLFWSMSTSKQFRRLLKKNVQNPLCVDIDVHDSHGSCSQLLTKFSHERWFMKEGLTRTPVREGRIRATLFLPPGDGPFPGVIDLYGAIGGLVEYRACLIANHGFATMALAYFDYEDLPPTLELMELEYFEEAVQYLQSHPKVKRHGIGVIGISKGADLSLSMASFLPEVKAAISISGCITPTICPLQYKGLIIHPLGYRTEGLIQTESGAFDTAEVFNDVKDPKYQHHIIPMEKAQGSFLFLAGDDDRSIPAVENVEEAIKLLQKHGKVNYEYHIYPGAGHLIEPPYFPLCRAAWNKLAGRVILWGGETKSQYMAQEDSWKSILNFLQKHLNSVNNVRSHL
ncbi:acyl-coenzyme A thioesterase 1-like [Protopterus annectens]|uniref:acyl-coenzyme A thioesterase 1-like n=1 Tax=Protopterus annectens TaxID=7888 RepID=UPI001CF9F69D|nr:acyl-coenzyme A thioesterase 1-like [Protopterus annectens]